ncbi:phosphoenolpyruvate synthase [Brevibacillus centrosporus]|uniref:Phosphoenolpyruvate synthase n=1 Tax=Brevibacillus centrosporus TaxID=54910 RepID=A0A1I3NAL3_9BACL|nr:phosphoenolpyruvate synthase [Brevibacillus centrosporus]SFJ06252.1 phosphoenolpyruvate synthase [Brevibacillus centrosporus]
MSPYVLPFQAIDKDSLSLVGGKGANLGELTKAGFPVPGGFCITTAAFQTLMETSNDLQSYLASLDELEPADLEGVRKIGKELRLHIESLVIPEEILSAVLAHWTSLGTMHAYAVRSSATAEDLPTASFAGQQETYLNVKGELQLISAIRGCWASLFSDRAIVYRMNNGFDHREVLLSIIVQQMVFPDVSGIMFTADPVSGHRGVITIEASLGLGEALVSGLVSPDRYQLKDNEIIDRHIAAKKVAIYGLAQGGTVKSDIPFSEQMKQALPDDRIGELADLGRKIESHYGTEQDIEWACAEGKLYILQARPITSLFPIPDTSDNQFHVFLSFGHQQMMTEAMSPMAISLWKQLMPAGAGIGGVKRRRTFVEAGGRLFIDPTEMLQYDFAQKFFPKMMGSIDELMSMALSDVLKRDHFHKTVSMEPMKQQLFQAAGPLVTILLKDFMREDSEHVYSHILEFMRKRLRGTREKLASVHGAEKIKALEENASHLMMDLFAHDIHYFVTGMLAFQLIQLFSAWWLDPPEDLQPLQKSLPHNVTAEMGLRLGDLADAARPYPKLIAYLQQQDKKQDFYQGLEQVEGGDVFRLELDKFLDNFGARCPGEIDLAKPRWREDPSMLLSSILGHLRTVEHGEHRERFKQGAAKAEETIKRILERVKDTPDGEFKHSFFKRLLTLFRNIGGLRENHKFVVVLHFDLYKKAILEEAKGLVEIETLADEKDVFFLSLGELKEVLDHTFSGDLSALIQSRKQAYEHYQKLTPPRVMTSEGEIIVGKRDLSSFPEGALVGTPVSPGVVEGYAKIVLKPESASLQPGEILIAPFTDPGWTPLFHQAKGLVMEVGGMMTHGAVVAREYGIPAVAGIDGATREIKDGQWIRLDGTQGYVLVTEEPKQQDQGEQQETSTPTQ